MTIEEKAKAYDEALNQAKFYHGNCPSEPERKKLEKMFPVLCESEDERIRKELINWINGKTTYEWSYEWCENKDRWIAYLEKQKEQKSYSLIYDKDLDKAAREYYLSGGADSPVDSTGLVPIVRMAEFGATWMKERMEKEQKPAEWGELQSEFKSINEAFEDGKKEVVAHPGRYGLCECVPAEWGDEDSDNLERVDNYLWMLDDYVGDDCAMPQGKAYNIRENIQEVLSPWLKSLPGRFNLQPRQEWGEEDRDTLLMAATVLKANFDSDEKFEDCDYDCGTLAGKLLEMRYRIGSSWKPSEEELRTLDIVITDYRHACTKGSDEKAETLKPLLEQLRKL